MKTLLTFVLLFCVACGSDDKKEKPAPGPAIVGSYNFPSDLLNLINSTTVDAGVSYSNMYVVITKDTIKQVATCNTPDGSSILTTSSAVEITNSTYEVLENTWSIETIGDYQCEIGLTAEVVDYRITANGSLEFIVDEGSLIFPRR